MHELLQGHLARRKIDAGVIDYKPVEKAAGQAVRQKALIRQGIDRELAKRLVKEVKDGKFKVQVTVQGDELRVSGKKRDDLQAVIQHLKGLSVESAPAICEFPRLERREAYRCHGWCCRLGLALMLVFAAGCGLRTSSFGGGWLGRSIPAQPRSRRRTKARARCRRRRTSRVSIATSKPVDAYVLLGGRIKSCWFNADMPLLRDHVYRADVSPDGSKVQITIHEKQALGRAGRLDLRRSISRQEGSSTVVSTENRKMPPDLAAKMQYDIDRWKRGESNCSREMPKSGCRACRRAVKTTGSALGRTSCRDIPGCGSRAGPAGRACRSNAASSGTRRRSAYSARRPLRG